MSDAIPRQIVKRILRTEKGSRLTESRNQYFFEVEISANKLEVKRAVEGLFGVKVRSVNTQIVPSKPKRVRQALGWTAERKKAIVTLEPGQKIDLAV